MATDSIPADTSESGSTAPTPGLNEALAGDAFRDDETIQPAGPAPSEARDLPLPPRMDGGQNVEEVLSQVSELFGHMQPAVSPAERPADDINEDLNDLTAAGIPAAKIPVGPGPTSEMKLGSAADLFRSSPEEIPTAAFGRGEIDDPSPASQAESPESQVPTSGGRAPTGVSPVTAAPKQPFGALVRIPPWARLTLTAVAALIVGWIAAVLLNRSHARQAAAAAPVAERPAEKGPVRSDELAAKAAALEEQLQQAFAERAAAQRDRQEAVVQLKLLEAQAQTGKRSTRAEIDREQAARMKAETNFLAAQERVRLQELRTYDGQLARVRDNWRRNPGLAMALLNDADRCPVRLRDFTWGYFRGRAQNDRATLIGHTGRVNAVAWSPIGKEIASCGQDGLVKFWDAASGKEIASLVAHAGGGLALAFSERGELLATAGADGTAKLWDVASRKIVGTFFGHLGAVRAVAISPDASTLVTAGDDGTVRFWDVVSRRATATRWGRPGSRKLSADDPSQIVHSIAYSPDGTLVASGGYGVVRLFEASSAVEKSMLTVAEGAVTALSFSRQGTTLAAGTDGAIYRWDVESLVPRSAPLAIDGRVNGLRYSTDGRMLAAATDRAALLFRQPADRPGEAPLRLAGHVGAVTGVALAPNGQAVVSSGDDGTLRLWDPQSGSVDKIEPDVVLRSRRPASAITYFADGKRMAVAGADAITLWNLSDGVETATLKSPSGDITQIAVSPDGTRLASAGKDWPILIWDLATQRVAAALNGHTGSVNSIRFSLDGKLVISGSDDGTVRLWDAAAARELATLSGHAAAVRCAVLSPDGKLAASSGSDHSVRLWDLAQKRLVATLAGHQAPVVALAFSRDSRWLASAESLSGSARPGTESSHRPIRLWRLPLGEAVHEFGPAGSSVGDVVFSPDGKTLATSDRDGVTLWDAEIAEPRETLRFPDAGPFAPLAFSPDGLTLAAGGQSAIVFWTAARFAHRP